jgi:crotonobetainyl-CoA:carnitine CoA-transferase CaiB-like acyl-CoA transferase
MRKDEFYADARDDLPGPLAGVRVLDVTTTWAGPRCSCVLADFGAEVIKVEMPEGEVVRRLPPMLPSGESFAHASVNRNKRCISLDLRTDEGQEIARQLVAQSDVVVENFRPGTLARWGLGYRDLCAVKPDLIYVSISGWGQFGPKHERAGYDPLAQAESGFISLNGTPEGEPVKAPTFLGDDLAGLHGALGALAALWHRERTGEGQHVDVALLDALLFQSNGFLTLGALGMPYPRMGNEYVFAAPANIYACRDGHVYAGVVLDSHWRTLVDVIGRADLREELATVSARLAKRDELNRMMAEWCRERTVAQVEEELSTARLAVARIRSYEESARDEHVLARDMLQDVTLPDGSTLPITGPAVKFSRTPTRIRTPAPEQGADDDEVLGGLGLSADAIASLRERGIIRQSG